MKNIITFIRNNYWKIIITVLNTIGCIILFIYQIGNPTRDFLFGWIIIIPILLFTLEIDNTDNGHGGCA